MTLAVKEIKDLAMHPSCRTPEEMVGLKQPITCDIQQCFVECIESCTIDGKLDPACFGRCTDKCIGKGSRSSLSDVDKGEEGTYMPSFLNLLDPNCTEVSNCLVEVYHTYFLNSSFSAPILRISIALIVMIMIIKLVAACSLDSIYRHINVSDVVLKKIGRCNYSCCLIDGLYRYPRTQADCMVEVYKPIFNSSNPNLTAESTDGLCLDEVQWMFIVYDFLQEYSFDLLVAWR
ncbi:hypothetical protein POM88_032754 [Heracleum sosnowskyi]|uniref:Uncharacterized protein n=1 Tax=Heracleum sosnowskyi TaxID=360622 RepID=A0AAD8MKC8_9APIA|nr:hypothetical protein POM88_032754 [Heracleum sosnowskyi]